MRLSKQAKADAIAAILENLYPETPIPLDHQDPYTLLVAVLLSAQCTDERVMLRHERNLLRLSSPPVFDCFQSQMHRLVQRQ